MNSSILVWLLLSTIWGSTWLFIKLGLQDLPPITFAGIRFTIAAIPLVVLLIVRRTPLPRNSRDWRLMAGTGILTFAVIYGLIFWGENYISSGLTSILYTTTPLFTLIFAHYTIPNEALTVRRLSGVLVGIGGVVLIFYNQIYVDDPLALWGSAAIVLAALATASNNVIIKKHTGHLDPMMLTTVQMIIGIIPLWLIGIPLEGNPANFNWTPMAWIALFYLAWMGTAFPFVLYYWLIKRMAVTNTTLIALSSTLIAVLLGWLILDEAFGWHTLFGGAAILIGLLLTTWKPTSQRKVVSFTDS